MPPGAQNSISVPSFLPLLSTTQFISSVQPAHSQVQPMDSLSTPRPGVYSRRSRVVYLEYPGCTLSVNCWGTGLYFKEVKSWIRKLKFEPQGSKNQKIKFSHTSQGPYLSYEWNLPNPCISPLRKLKQLLSLSNTINLLKDCIMKIWIYFCHKRSLFMALMPTN